MYKVTFLDSLDEQRSIVAYLDRLQAKVNALQVFSFPALRDAMSDRENG
jgi:hypothetical protein